MPQDTQSFVWKGDHIFQIIGTDHHEDTIKIIANTRKSESLVSLILPTLAITYADMTFANAIGGVQENYPGSKKYGKKFFDPPVIINNEEEIEKYTWIRGANKVTIGPKETVIEWNMFKTLVIPRLRIDSKKPVEAIIRFSPVSIDIKTSLKIDVIQLADGRPIGGIRVEKRHPDWKPQEPEKKYDLRVHVSNSKTLQPLVEGLINFFRWSDKESTPYGNGGFRKTGQKYTDGNGSVHCPDRPSDALEAITAGIYGRASVARCFRALPGQHVRHEIWSWPLEKEERIFVWTREDTLGAVAALTGISSSEILKANGLSDEAALKAGIKIRLPCFAASCQPGSGDTFEGLAHAFMYRDAEELAHANKLHTMTEWDGSKNIRLPGWSFVYARRGDTLERIDKFFMLPEGSSHTLGRVHHPDPRLPFEAEIIAVPTEEFVKTHFP